MTTSLINTPLQRGDRERMMTETVLTVSMRGQTVETVSESGVRLNTPLKQGVNEMFRRMSRFTSAATDREKYIL